MTSSGSRNGDRRWWTTIALLAVGCLAPSSRAAVPEVRGTWLTTTNEDHIRTGGNTATVMRDLRNIGLNTAYVESLKDGYANFPSQTLKTITGTVDRNPFLGATRDLVQETLIQAHRQGTVYYAWFEYGLATQFIGNGGNPSNAVSTYMKNRGWLLQDKDGKYANATYQYAWMNPAVPEVRQYLIDVVLEAVERYDLDGVQFDDRLAWPVDFGFDATTIGLYTSQTGNPAPTSPTDSTFTVWRRQQVTEFASQMYDAVKSARPDVKFSVAPSITGFSQANYNADWPAWESQGVFDEFAVQMYRSTYSAFSSIVNSNVNPFKPDDLDKMVMGLRINPSSSATPYADVEQMIQRARAEGAAGHSLWYSAGARDLYGSQLTAFYDVAGQGQAANPNFDDDHRPPPVVATADAFDPGVWSADVPTAGRYRVVARLGTAAPWVEIAAAELAAGSQQFSVPGASQVELLVDRRTRGSFLGDFDDNRVVDGADFLAWQSGFGQLVFAPAAAGDATHDGKVNGLDLPSWKFNFGLNLPPSADSAATRVPEPAAALLASGAAAWTIVRRRR